MRLTARSTKPDAIEVTIQMTATAGEWRELISQMGQKWPSWSVASAIQRALVAFDQTHEDTVEVE